MLVKLGCGKVLRGQKRDCHKFNYTFIHEDTVSTSTSMWVKKPLSNTIQFYEVTSDVVVRKHFVHNLDLIADAKYAIQEF